MEMRQRMEKVRKLQLISDRWADNSKTSTLGPGFGLSGQPSHPIQQSEELYGERWKKP